MDQTGQDAVPPPSAGTPAGVPAGPAPRPAAGSPAWGHADPRARDTAGPPAGAAGMEEALARRRAEGRPVLDLSSDEPGTPPYPALADRLAEAAQRTAAYPVAGGPAARDAACGYFERRGLPAVPGRIVFGPGSTALLLAVLASAPGGVLLPRPCPAGYEAQAALLGRRVSHLPVPAECGGVPDPFALLESVRRARENGTDPRVLVLSVPDGLTGALPPPELLHEVCEAARDLDLLVVSDELHRDLPHDPATVVLSPAEMIPERTVVITGLDSAYGLGGWRVGFARFPEGGRGDLLLRGALATARTVWSSPPAPLQDAVAHVLSEPPELRKHTTSCARLHGVVTAAAARVLGGAGVLCRPPETGFHLYPDLAPVRAALAGRGITGSPSLERHLLDRHGIAVLGGHRFGDDPSALRFRVTTGLLHGSTAEAWRDTLGAADPLTVPHVAQALSAIGAAFTELTEG